MARVDVTKTIETTLIAAFSFTAAFLWRDVINEFITIFVPARGALAAKLLAALFATGLLIAAIYTIYGTEREAKRFVRKYKRRHKR